MIRKNHPKLNKRKTREAIKYILQKTGGVSETKLKYLLYFLDMDFYEKHEEQFLGLTYIRTKQGIDIL